MNARFLKPLLLLFLLATPCSVSAAENPPNIIVLVTDDQGWGDIGYNNPKVYTPNLDRLASESAVLTQHYVMPQCTPTRLALISGRYPGRFGITGLQASNDPIIPHGTLTLPSFLKASAAAITQAIRREKPIVSSCSRSCSSVLSLAIFDVSLVPWLSRVVLGLCHGGDRLLKKYKRETE